MLQPGKPGTDPIAKERVLSIKKSICPTMKQMTKPILNLTTS
jgi:hypothetical protein